LLQLLLTLTALILAALCQPCASSGTKHCILLTLQVPPVLAFHFLLLLSAPPAHPQDISTLFYYYCAYLGKTVSTLETLPQCSGRATRMLAGGVADWLRPHLPAPFAQPPARGATLAAGGLKLLSRPLSRTA